MFEIVINFMIEFYGKFCGIIYEINVLLLLEMFLLKVG